MSKSLLEFLRPGPTAPKTVLLPDSCFFVRLIELDQSPGASGVETQVELALEGLSPFPVAQLYFGFFWTAGAPRALVYAAYRRRFSQEQTELWAGADLVIPRFGALLAEPAEPGTTRVYGTDEGWTAIHWDAQGLPVDVSVSPVPEGASEEQRIAARDALIARFGGTLHLDALTEAPAAAANDDEDTAVFRAGDRSFSITAPVCAHLDVRPREELARHRQAQRRDLVLWRVCLGMLAAIALIAFGEVAMGVAWGFEKSKEAQVKVQRPLVEHISNAQQLAFRIDELSSKRLLPFEMLDAIGASRPRTIQFTKCMTTALNVMRIEAQTASPGDVAGFQAALGKNPAVDRVEVSDMSSRDRLTRFTLLVTFKADALKPAQS